MRKLNSVADFSKDRDGPKSSKPLSAAQFWSRHYWLDKLSDKKLIDAQIMFHLFVSRIHNPFKSYYHNFSPRSSLGLNNNHNHCKESHETNSKLGRQLGRQAEPMSRLASDANQWDWQGVPDLHPLLRRYEYCSLFWMIYALIKAVFGDALFGLVERATDGWLLMNFPANCIFIGRFIFQPGLEHICCRIFCIFHLVWRYIQQGSSRSYMLAPLMFLLQSEHDIEKFYKIMHENRQRNYLIALSWPKLLTDRSAEALSTASAPNSDLVSKKQQQQQQQSEHGVSAHELFFRHIMCYEIHINGKIYHKLRPNRTLQSRKSLMHNLIASTVLISCYFLWLMIVISSGVFFLVADDANYARLYPGCTPELSRKFKPVLDPLMDWLWFAPDKTFLHLGIHRLLALLLDLAESFIIWTDSVLAITYVLGLAYLLNCDVLLYWRHLHAELENIVTRLKLSRCKALFESSKKRSLRQSQSISVAKMGGNIATSVRMIRTGQRPEAQLESEINEFQFELIDFFCQVERADKMVSDIITTTMLIWVVDVAYASYYTLKLQIELPFAATFIFGVGLTVLTLASEYLLKLHKCCMKTYRLMCTLMAYDQGRTKKRFMKLLEYFDERNRTTYTIFQRYPYVSTTYISMAGWSLSCYFITRSIFSMMSPSR